MTTFDNLMTRLAGDVLGSFGREAAWNAVYHPDVKLVFNGIRDALAVRPLWFNNTSVEHSPDGNTLWVKYKFSGRNGTAVLTWNLSKAMVEKAQEGLDEFYGRHASEDKVATRMSTAVSALRDFAADPSGENKAELSDYGINVFREEARRMGYDRRKMLAIMEEEAKRIRGLTADEAGLRAYFRMNRAGSEHLVSRVMRIGIFCQLAALGHLRKGKVAGGPSWSDALFALKGQQKDRLHKANVAFHKSFMAYLKKLGAALKSYGVTVQPRGSYIDTEMHGSDGLRMLGEVHFDLANFNDPKGRSFKDFMQDEFDVWGINHKNVWDFGEY